MPPEDDISRPHYMTDDVWRAFSRPQTIKVVKVVDDEGNVYELENGFKLVTNELKPVLSYYYPAYRTKEKTNV